jgi:hypothetical protein
LVVLNWKFSNSEYLEISYIHISCKRKSVAYIVWFGTPLSSMRMGIWNKTFAIDWDLLGLLLKHHIPRKEVTTLLFSLKLGVFKPSITTPYGPHKRWICYIASNEKIYEDHIPLRMPPFQLLYNFVQHCRASVMHRQLVGCNFW